jgi:hypothetical protein
MSTPLRDLLHDVLFDPPARAAFSADPARFLGDHGWDGLEGRDVEAALSAYVEELPPDEGARLATVVAADGAFDDGLAGAITGLEAAASAIDGGSELAGEDLDPGASLDELGEPATEATLGPESELEDAGTAGWLEEIDTDSGFDDPAAAHDEPTAEDGLAGLSFGAHDPADELDDVGAPVELDDELDTPADPGTEWVDDGDSTIDDEPDDVID